MTSKQRTPVPKPVLTDQLHNQKASQFRKYMDKVLGEESLLHFLEYELITAFFGDLSGGVGYFTRKLLYPRLLRNAGRGIILGKGLILRHPLKISIGDRVAIDDYGLLDASGAGEEGIVLEEDIIISRNCVIQGKAGPVTIGARTDIGCNTIISSVSGIHIGRSVLIAGNCYIGGGRYYSQHLGIPMIKQGLYSEGPVVIGDDVWLGAGVIVPDGRRIGKGCIVGAGAVITKDLPDFAIAFGVPAAVRGYRGNGIQQGIQTSA